MSHRHMLIFVWMWFTLSKYSWSVLVTVCINTDCTWLVIGFWVELFFSGSQLCLVYILSWHFITPYVTNLLLIRVYFHLLCSALVLDSSACLQMALSPIKKKTTAKKSDKKLKMDDTKFRSLQHFERYKDFYLRATIIQERFVDLMDLKDTFIPSCFEGRGWERLLSDLPGVSEPLIREFYANAVLREDELNC